MSLFQREDEQGLAEEMGVKTSKVTPEEDQELLRGSLKNLGKHVSEQTEGDFYRQFSNASPEDLDRVLEVRDRLPEAAKKAIDRLRPEGDSVKQGKGLVTSEASVKQGSVKQGKGLVTTEASAKVVPTTAATQEVLLEEAEVLAQLNGLPEGSGGRAVKNNQQELLKTTNAVKTFSEVEINDMLSLGLTSEEIADSVVRYIPEAGFVQLEGDASDVFFDPLYGNGKGMKFEKIGDSYFGEDGSIVSPKSSIAARVAGNKFVQGLSDEQRVSLSENMGAISIYGRDSLSEQKAVDYQLASVLSKFSAIAEDRTGVELAPEWLAVAIPFVNRLARSRVTGEEGFMSAEEAVEWAEDFATWTTDQQLAYLSRFEMHLTGETGDTGKVTYDTDLNVFAAIDKLTSLQNISTSGRTEAVATDLLDWADVFTLVPATKLLSGASKGAMMWRLKNAKLTITRMAKNNGNRKAQMDRAQKLLASSLDEQSLMDEAFEVSMPRTLQITDQRDIGVSSSVVPSKSNRDVGFSGGGGRVPPVDDGSFSGSPNFRGDIEAAQTLIDEDTTSVLTQTEAERGVERAMNSVYGSSNLPTPTAEELEFNSLATRAGGEKRDVVTAFIGNKVSEDTAPGFATAQAAFRYAQEAGMKEGFYRVEEINGEHWLAIDKPITEAGLVEVKDGELLGTSMLASSPGLSTVTQFFGGTKLRSDPDFSTQFSAAVGQESRWLNTVNRFNDRMNSLVGKKRKHLWQVVTLGREAEKWYTPNQFRDKYRAVSGEAPSEKVMEAYYSYKAVSDLDWHIMNKELVRELDAKGFEEIHVDNAPSGLVGSGQDVSLQSRTPVFRGNGKIETASSIRKAEGVRFSKDGRYHNVGSVSSNSLKAWEEEGYKFIRLDTARTVAGREVDYIAVPPSQIINTRTVRDDQLPYVEGGSRIYKGRFFIKQPQTFNGVKVKDKTNFVIRSKADADMYAAEYNEALAAFNLAEQTNLASDIANATRIISEKTMFQNYNTFKEAIDSGKINRNEFEVVFDNDVTKGKSAKVSPYQFDPAEEFSEMASNLMNRGEMWYSPRGEHIRHPRGDLAELVDPGETMTRQASHAGGLFAYNAMKGRQAQRFVALAGADVVPGKNLVDTALNGQIIAKDPDRAFELEAHRRVFRQSLNQPRLEEALVQQSTVRLANKVDSLMGREGNYGTLLAESLRDGKIRPLSWMKKYNYQMFFGFLEESQIIVQTSMIPGAIAVSPKNGARSVALYPHLRKALVAPNRETVREVAKSNYILTEQQFMDMYDDIVKSGLANVDNTQAMLDDASDATLAKGVAKVGLEKAGRASTFFFREAERANKLIGASISWLDQGGNRLTNEQQWRTFSSRADLLAGNMSKSGNSWLQQGVTSVPMQMQSQPFRTAELMYTKQGRDIVKEDGTIERQGGLTGKEKTKFSAAMLLLYGSGGVALGLPEMAYSYYTEATGKNPTAKEHAAATRFLSGILFPDTDTTRIEPLGGRTLLSTFADPETKVWELAAGPSGRFLNDAPNIGRGLKIAVKALAGHSEFQGEDRLAIARMALEPFAQQPASFSRKQKGLHAALTGEYLTAGGVTAEELSLFESYMVSLGFPPARATEYWTTDIGEGMTAQEYKGAVKDRAKIVSGYLRRFYDSSLTEKERRAAYATAIAFSAIGNGREGPKGELSRLQQQVMVEATEMLGRELTTSKLIEGSRLVGKNPHDIYIYTSDKENRDE